MRCRWNRYLFLFNIWYGLCCEVVLKWIEEGMNEYNSGAGLWWLLEPFEVQCSQQNFKASLELQPNFRGNSKETHSPQGIVKASKTLLKFSSIMETLLKLLNLNEAAELQANFFSSRQRLNLKKSCDDQWASGNSNESLELQRTFLCSR